MAKYRQGQRVWLVEPKDKSRKIIFAELSKYIGQRGMITQLREIPEQMQKTVTAVYQVKLKENDLLVEVPEDFLEPLSY